MTERSKGLFAIIVGIVGLGYLVWSYAPAENLGVIADTLDVEDRQACAVEPTGTVACWGRNISSRPSQDGFLRDEGPLRADGLVDAIDVGVAYNGGAACAARETGQLVCWGWVAGLGADDPAWDGVRYSRVTEPAAVVGLDDVRHVYGGARICVEHLDDRISCSGNGPGFLEIPELRGTSDIFTSDEARCGLADDGTVRCVDRDDGTASAHYENVVELRAWMDRAVDGFHCVAFAEDPPSCGEMRCLVRGCAGTGSFTQAALVGASEVVSVDRDYCGLFDGQLRCARQGDDATSAALTDATATSNIVTIDVSDSMACFVDEAGHVHCSGRGPDWTIDDDVGFQVLPETYVPWRHRLAWLAAFGLVLALGLSKVRTSRATADTPTTDEPLRRTQ